MVDILQTAPKLSERAFTCPHCGVLASQYWRDLIWEHSWSEEKHQTDAKLSECSHCEQLLLWWHINIVAPAVSSAPFGHAEMPDSAKQIYEEARSVLPYSPRASVALLRLTIEVLIGTLGRTDGKLDKRIGELVSEGLSTRVQQALDVVRVVGNNAVHPGQITLDDDADVATALFSLINYVTERMIAEPKKIGELFDSLPQGAKKAIEKRDTPKQIEHKTDEIRDRNK